MNERSEMADITNKLLTTLLVVGLSATARAEPTVYYCNTIKYGEVTKEKVSNIRSYPFKLFVDTEARPVKVKVAGETINFEATDGVRFANVTLWNSERNFGENAFYGNKLSSIFDFRGGIFAYTAIISMGKEFGKEMVISSYQARCDKF